MVIIIDESASETLELVQELAAIGELDRVCDGIYTINAVTRNAVFDITDEYPQAIMKIEVV